MAPRQPTSPRHAGVCSLPVLLRSRRARARLIPQSREIDVLPPDEAAFASGARAYRCLAHALTGPDPRTSEFSRQPAPGRVPGTTGPGPSAASEVKGLAGARRMERTGPIAEPAHYTSERIAFHYTSECRALPLEFLVIAF